MDGIPVMLKDDAEPDYKPWVEWFDNVAENVTNEGGLAEDTFRVDPFVQQSIAGTNGEMYRSLVGNLPRYPVPELRLPPLGYFADSLYVRATRNGAGGQS